jgi:integrase
MMIEDDVAFWDSCERASKKLDLQIAVGRAKTVSQVANEYYDRHVAHLTATTRWQATKWLKTFVHDTMGDMPIEKVDRKTILERCEFADLWAGQRPTARGLRSHLDRMFSFAIEYKYYHGENPMAWKGLRHVLQSSAHRVRHHDALAYQDVGRFMGKLRAYKDERRGHKNERTTASLAVEFVVLTGVRLNEVRSALWKEIDIPTHGLERAAGTPQDRTHPRQDAAGTDHQAHAGGAGGNAAAPHRSVRGCGAVSC